MRGTCPASVHNGPVLSVPRQELFALAHQGEEQRSGPHICHMLNLADGEGIVEGVGGPVRFEQATIVRGMAVPTFFTNLVMDGTTFFNGTAAVEGYGLDQILLLAALGVPTAAVSSWNNPQQARPRALDLIFCIIAASDDSVNVLVATG